MLHVHNLSQRIVFTSKLKLMEIHVAVNANLLDIQDFLNVVDVALFSTGVVSVRQ